MNPTSLASPSQSPGLPILHEMQFSGSFLSFFFFFFLVHFPPYKCCAQGQENGSAGTVLAVHAQEPEFSSPAPMSKSWYVGVCNPALKADRWTPEAPWLAKSTQKGELRLCERFYFKKGGAAMLQKIGQHESLGST